METSTPRTVHAVPAIARWIRAVGWLRDYDRSWFRGDDVAVKLGGVDRSLSVTDAVDAFQKQTTT